jgi:WD40 repeat protein
MNGISEYPITSLTLLENRGQIIATSSEGSAIYLLDLKMNKVVRKYEHEKFYNSAAHVTISPSASLVLAGNCDGSIYYWNCESGASAGKISGHDGPVTALQYHRRSKTLVTADK